MDTRQIGVGSDVMGQGRTDVKNASASCRPCGVCNTTEIEGKAVVAYAQSWNLNLRQQGVEPGIASLFNGPHYCS